MEGSDADASDQSEFNSDAEEIEFGLYASLYFEPNPDFVPGGNIKTHKNDNQIKNNFQSDVENVPDAPPKHTSQTKIDLIDTIVDDEQSNNILYKCKNYDKEKEENEKSIVGETHRPIIDFNDEINKESDHNVNLKIQNKDKIEKEIYKHKDIDVLNQDQDIIGEDAEMETRVRQSSICSVDSIAGNTKLDSLYTMNFSSSDEDDYQQVLDSKLAINNLILKENRKKELTTLNSKRKRNIKESNESESDDNEDSKCHIMNKAVKKKKLKEGSKTDYKEIVSSETDSDIYVLPPSPKQFETLDVSSETESEPHKTAIIESIEGSVPKIVNNSSLRTKNSSTQLMKSKNLKCKSTEISKKGMILSIDEFSNKSISNKNNQCKDHQSSKGSINISEDSDDSIDIAEISKGTDLVMNLGGGLNSFIERPGRKKSKEKKKKKSEKSVQSSVTGVKNSYADYTKGRQVTTKIPSCNKWTPEMATFYDTDISEDLEIEEVHAQQSDSPLLWNIISRDYPIKGRRRYFNQEVRCKRCRQFGHEEKGCPRVPRCHLCSETDHVVRYQCPNNCCFRCGEEPHAFCRNTLNTTICELCGWPGHITDLCPDLWRRFHLTTSGIDPQPPILLGNILRPRSEAYCYCCGRKGHFGHECSERQQIRSCVPVSQSVVSYAPPVLEHQGKKVINFEGCDGPLEEAPYNPVTKIKIKMKDGGRIVGKSGVIVKDIERRTGAKVNIVTKNGKQMVCVYGSVEARNGAKNLVEVLIGKRSPDGLENFVIHVARINNDPSVLSLLKKYPGPHGNISPKVIKKTINEFPPFEVSKDKAQKTEVTQERKLFNETPKTRLGEDDSLKEDFLSLIPNSVPSLIRENKEYQSININDSLYTDVRNLITLKKSLKQVPQLSKDASLQKDFLSLNSPKRIKLRNDEGDDDSLYTDVRNLITLKKSLKHVPQLSQDASLQKDFLSLNSPKRIKLRNDEGDDDIQILKSNVDKRNKPKNLKNETDYLVEFLSDESNSEMGNLNMPRETNTECNISKLEEEIDNLGIQCTFMKGLKQDLPRNKRLLLEKTQDLLARIDSMDNRIQPIVNKIKNNLKIFKQPNPAFQHKKWLKKNLQALSMVVVGQERLGSGANLRNNLDSLLKDVKASKGKASPELVKEISKTFKKICDPSVKQIDEMLNLASIFMQKYPQGKSSVTEYAVKISKKGSKKLKALEKDLKNFKKNRISDKGKLNKLRSPNSYKKKNKETANKWNEFEGLSRKSIDLNKRPKKNKKKKLKIHTKDGKRNWNAVFANS